MGVKLSVVISCLKLRVPLKARIFVRVRGYILDDQGALRKHVAIFVNHELIHDRTKLSDPVHINDDKILPEYIRSLLTPEIPHM